MDRAIYPSKSYSPLSDCVKVAIRRDGIIYRFFNHCLMVSNFGIGQVKDKIIAPSCV